MKLLLTSSGIRNKNIENALVGLLGKPIAESSALVVPTSLYPFSVGRAWRGGRSAERTGELPEDAAARARNAIVRATLKHGTRRAQPAR